MAQEVFTFDRKSMELIKRMVQREMRRVQNTQESGKMDRPTAYKYTRLAKLTTALAEGSGETATATLMRWDSDTEDWVDGTSPDDDFEVVNFFTILSAGIGTRIICSNLFGKWVVEDTDCEA